SLRLIERTLQQYCPDLPITARPVPDVEGGFDVYLLDIDFGGKTLGPRLARQLRARQPGALIIAITGGLEPRQFTTLLDAGFDGVCDKSVPSDLQTTALCVRRYAQLLRGEAGDSS